MRLYTLTRRSRSTRHPPPRWRILPPEVIHIIVELLKDDETTLRACSYAIRDFSQPALSRIGRHITVNHVLRIKQCVHLLTANSAFQHVRSLDFGVTSKSSNPEDYLEEHFTILNIFAQRQALTRLWLSRVPFSSIEAARGVKIRDMVTALGSTVNDLGLYGCKFPSYNDMISFIRAFPHCDSLFIRDCIADGKDPIGTTFSELSQHRLSLNTLELTTSSWDRLIIGVSTLIEDAGLDVSRLSALTCDIGSVRKARSVSAATSKSPVKHFQLTIAQPGVFQGVCGN